MGSPELLVVAGPNGAGKTTFALKYANRIGVTYIGADAIAEKISPGNPSSARVPAARQFLKTVGEHLSSFESLIVETTLSGRCFRRTIANAKQAGFRVSIVYLILDSAESCLARIEQRVRKGGHHVPEHDVRRRFLRSTANFWNIYRYLADDWVVWYNTGGQLQEVAAGSREQLTIRNTTLFNKLMYLVESFCDE